MEEIKSQLLKNRPSLSEGSIKTYTSLIKSIHSKVFPNETFDIENLNDYETVINYLSPWPYNKRKTTLSALFVLTHIPEYQQLMMEDLQIHNNKELEQTQNEKQEANMIPFEEVKKIVNKYEKNTKLLYKKEGALDMKDLQQIQLFIILALTTGYYFEPRRSQDWIMSFRDYDEDSDNYYDRETNEFVFNKYKTSNLYGTHIVKPPRKVKTILQKWLDVNPTNYVLFNSKGKPLTPPEIAHRLNEIFGRQVSTSMLRHIYLTNYYSEKRKLKEMTETAKNMGHSVTQALAYVKNPAEEK